MYTKEEVQMFRSMDERGFVLEEHQELAVLREDIAALMAGNERLRAALHDLVERCRDDFNGGRKLRRGDVDRARAALEGRSCTCHPSEAPTPCQQKYALGECIKAALEGRT